MDWNVLNFNKTTFVRDSRKLPDPEDTAKIAGDEREENVPKNTCEDVMRDYSKNRALGKFGKINNNNAITMKRNNLVMNFRGSLVVEK